MGVLPSRLRCRQKGGGTLPSTKEANLSLSAKRYCSVFLIVRYPRSNSLKYFRLRSLMSEGGTLAGTYTVRPSSSASTVMISLFSGVGVDVFAVVEVGMRVGMAVIVGVGV